jgi:hypothetical protein
MPDSMSIARAIADELPSYGCTGKPFSTIGGAVLVYVRDERGNDQGRIAVAADGSITGRYLPPDRHDLLTPAKAVAERLC